MTRRLRGLCLLFATAALLLASAPAGADSLSRSMQADAARPPALLDAMLLRPFGVVATMLGTTAFVFASPVFLLTRPTEMDEPFKALVVRPAAWTWARPLGGL